MSSTTLPPTDSQANGSKIRVRTAKVLSVHDFPAILRGDTPHDAPLPTRENLSGANLTSADLRYANLSGANLRYANTSYTIGLAR